MEKSASGTAKQFKRLLILVTLLFSSVNLFGITPREAMAGVEIKSTEEFCFTGKSTQFTFTVNGIEPKYIEFYIDKVPDGVNFLSSSKAASGDGTVISLLFQFEKTGKFKINPLVCLIKGYMFYVPFKAVDVYENPDTIHPELYIDFANPLYNNENAAIKVAAGSHVVFTISVRYAVQIVDFTYDLPKDSIFTELKRFPITEGLPRKAEFSTEIEKIATFDWQPLGEGDWSLPLIKVTATSYNGGRYVMKVPERTVIVQPASKDNSNEKTETFFANAFTEDKFRENEYAVKEMPDEEVVRLAELRREERKNFPFSKIRKERIALETEYGLVETAKEPCLPFYISLIVLTVIVLVVSIILYAKKKYLYGIICSCAVCVFLVCAIVLTVKMNVKTAVFTGTSLAPVPEENGSVSVTLEKGSHITVTKKAGKWLYVKVDETYGWTTEDKVIYIHK